MSFLAALGIVHFGLFCLAVLLLNVTPGPDTAFIVGQSVARGRRTGIMAALGISLGCMVHTAALALGLSALLAASSSAFLAIKIAGAIYLTFLGVRMIVGASRRSAVADERVAVAEAGSRAATTSSLRAFAQGLVTNVSNPKVVLFFLSFLPQFVDATRSSQAWAFLVLGLVIVVMTSIYNVGVAWLAGSLTRRMRSLPRVRQWLERSIGLAFVALGARIAFADR